MLQKLIKPLKKHPIATRTLEGAIAGYLLVSPILMLISDMAHRSKSIEYIKKMHNSPVIDMAEVFSPKLLPWVLTYTAITAAVAGCTAILSEKEHKIEKDHMKSLADKYHEVCEENTLGFYTLDMHGNFLSANQIFLDTTGYESVAELRQKGFDRIMGGTECNRSLDEIMDDIESLSNKTLNLKRKDGKQITVFCTSSTRNNVVTGMISPIYADGNEYIPICSFCDSAIKGDEKEKLSVYLRRLRKKIDIKNCYFSHGICRPCYDEYFDEEKGDFKISVDEICIKK